MARSKGQISAAQKAKAQVRRPRKSRQTSAVMYAENDPENEHVPAIRQHSPASVIPTPSVDDLEILASLDGITTDFSTGASIIPTSFDSVRFDDPDVVTDVTDDPFPGVSHSVREYIKELQAHVVTLEKQLGERHDDTSQLIRVLEKSQRRLRLQSFKHAALQLEVSKLRPLQEEVATLRIHVNTLETSVHEGTMMDTSQGSLPAYNAPLTSREATLTLGSECYRVVRPTGGSGTRVTVNPRLVLEHYSDQQLDIIFHPSVDSSGLSFGHNVLRSVAIGQFYICPDVIPAANAMISKDGVFFESISRISTDQATSVSSRVFFTRVSSPAQFIRFSTDDGMLWDFPQVSLWLSQASHAAVTYATRLTIPSQLAGFDFVKFTPIAQQSVEGTLARSQLFAGLLGSSGCSVTSFAIQGSISEFFDALRNMGHTFCLLFDDDEYSTPWRTLMDTIVNTLVLHSAAQRSVQFLVFSFNLCLQQWGLTLQKLNTYRGIPVRVLDQRFAKLLLEQMAGLIPLKALDQHQFETAAAASIASINTVAPIYAATAPLNVFTEVARQRESPSASPTGFENSSTVCFTHLDFILQLAPLGCTKPKCSYPHLSLDEVRSNKALLTPLVRSRVDRLTALEQI